MENGTIVMLIPIISSLAVIVLLGLTVWNVISYLWRNLCGWYQDREGDKMMKHWDDMQKSYPCRFRR
jgi:hypothetical protein